MEGTKELLALSMGMGLFFMLAAEVLWPARQFIYYRYWWLFGLGVTGVFVVLANGWSLLVPKDWLREHRLFNGEQLGLAGLAIWYPVNTFVTYWYHRFQHRFSLAWRLLHQVHHGVPRVDIPSALMAHPLDVFVSTTSSIIVTAFVLGLDPRAVAVASMLQFFIALFPHWNVRTPRWAGYIIQRPEEHILHHERGVHAGNYSDWPLWDRVFNTYRAPIENPVVIGFERSGWAEQLKMLAFADINPSN